jgi:serine/threonine protein kinase
VSSTGWVIKTKWGGGYYALKRVNDAKQFGMQAPILASLWHPHIVQLINYWEERGKLFMLMEYMDCGDLANFIAKKQTLQLSVVIDILIQAARSMYYLHNKGIAHDGFKCANLLMTCDPNREGYYIVRLGGFGSARRVSFNPIVFAKDIYNFGSICYKSITQLISNEYWSREIHDSSIQSLRLY